MENIKSFFVREDELLAKPKNIPESASEVFERPGARTAPHRIVERPLPAGSTPTQPQALPFSPEQLRSALARQQRPVQATPPVPATEPAVRAPVIEEREIAGEIDAFESALRNAHREVDATTARSGTRDALETGHAASAIARPARTAPAPRESAFDTFDRFLLEENLASDDLLDKDILHRLREFHKHQREGKQYYLYTQDAKAAIARKIGQLKLLEREWLGTRDELDDLEHGLTSIEQEIETRSRELRDLLSQAKSATRLEKTAPIGQEFRLRDGRRLDSLLDLRVALRTMPEDVFRHHVNATRNDFAAWARMALGEAQLADEMARITERHELALFLSKAGT